MPQPGPGGLSDLVGAENAQCRIDLHGEPRRANTRWGFPWVYPDARLPGGLVGLGAGVWCPGLSRRRDASPA